MFNKPNVFGRDESVARRDGQPVTSSGPKSPSSVSAANQSAAVRNAIESSPPTVSTQSPNPATPPVTGSAPANENLMGARLIVGPDVKLRGAEILDCDTLVVEGRVEATMDSRVIRIAEHGSFSGKVSIDIAEIHGTFEGELTARSQLIIHATGRVSGTIRFGKLVVDEGGELCGEINVLSEPVTSAKTKSVVEPFVALSAAAS